MKKMKKQLVSMLSAMAVVALYANIVSADVIGGYISTERNEIVVVFDAISTQKILLGASLDAIKIGVAPVKSRGSLYVVSPNGRWQTSMRAYRDKAGLTITLPSDRFDKVIYVDSRMKIRGGIGLTDKEIAQLATINKFRDASRAAELVKEDRAIDLLESVELAADAARDAYPLTHN